ISIRFCLRSICLRYATQSRMSIPNSIIVCRSIAHLQQGLSLETPSDLRVRSVTISLTRSMSKDFAPNQHAKMHALQTRSHQPASTHSTTAQAPELQTHSSG